jgi:hypothetical protein
MTAESRITPAQTARWKETLPDRVATAKVFVAAIRAKTFCASCGAQPIEWHHPDHPQKPNNRVSARMARGNRPKLLQREIDRCTPFCRPCHMEEDGRLHRPRVVGVNAPNAKMNERKVRDARTRHNAGEPIASIARSYRVDEKTIRNIVEGKKWRHVS